MYFNPEELNINDIDKIKDKCIEDVHKFTDNVKKMKEFEINFKKELKKYPRSSKVYNEILKYMCTFDNMKILFTLNAKEYEQLIDLFDKMYLIDIENYRLDTGNKIFAKYFNKNTSLTLLNVITLLVFNVNKNERFLGYRELYYIDSRIVEGMKVFSRLKEKGYFLDILVSMREYLKDNTTFINNEKYLDIYTEKYKSLLDNFLKYDIV